MIKLNINNNYLVNCEKILAIFPINAKSHYLAFEPLAIELANKGHKLTIINNFPQKISIKNINYMDISNYTNLLIGAVNVNDLKNIPTNTYDECNIMNKMLLWDMNIFEIPIIKKLFLDKKLNNSYKIENFDLIIVETFNSYLYHSLSHVFNAPIIGFTFSTIMPWVNSKFSNPENPSYIPILFSQLNNKMNFYQRLKNSFELFYSKIHQKYIINPKGDLFLKNYYGNNYFPSLDVLSLNASLLFFNSHYSIHGARPLVPQVIEIGGLHIGPKKKIPQVY